MKSTDKWEVRVRRSITRLCVCLALATLVTLGLTVMLAGGRDRPRHPIRNPDTGCELVALLRPLKTLDTTPPSTPRAEPTWYVLYQMPPVRGWDQVSDGCR